MSGTAYIALGSNLGDKAANLRAAVAALARLERTQVIARSSIWRTPPWGKTDQDWFANAVVGVETSLAPLALLDACLAIERTLGRVRFERWGPRVIDLDLLLHGEIKMKSERLTLPHPAIVERAFVLVPLCEIAPDVMIGGQSASMALARLDRAGIEPMGPL